MSDKDLKIDNEGKISKIKREVIEKSLECIGKKLKEISITVQKLENDKRDKGFIGNAIQQDVFNIPVNNDSAADFKKYYGVDLELKVTPLKKLVKSGKNVAKERMSLNMINYDSIINENFYTSSFLEKNTNLHIIFYLFQENTSIKEYKVLDFANINLNELKEFEVIKKDWETIKNKVVNKKAHMLSGSDTYFLEATRKGGKNDKETEYLNGKCKAKRRALAFKQRFVNIILEQYTYKYLDKFKSNKNKALKNNTAEKIKWFSDEEILKIFSEIKQMGNWKELYIKKIGKEIHPDNKSWHWQLLNKILKDNYSDFYKFRKSTNFYLSIKYLNNNKIQEQINTYLDVDISNVLETNFEDSDIRNFMIDKRFYILGINKENWKIEKLFLMQLNEDKIDEHYQQWEKFQNEIRTYLENGNNEEQFLKSYKTSGDCFFHIRPHAMDKTVRDKNINIIKSSYWITLNNIKEFLEEVEL